MIYLYWEGISRKKKSYSINSIEKKKKIAYSLQSQRDLYYPKCTVKTEFCQILFCYAHKSSLKWRDRSDFCFSSMESWGIVITYDYLKDFAFLTLEDLRS